MLKNDLESLRASIMIDIHCKSSGTREIKIEHAFD